ncbi:MAG TPA: S8 family serine peptidase [Polyangium sp.]|jgi:serine protease AprX|nr:S8 family serine peptidase [Polyangium sp.]
MARPQLLSIPERIEASTRFTGRGVTIALVDSGFYPHPDLMRPKRRIKAYADATREEAVPDEFFTPRGASWHGTMTACTAAGNGYVSGGRYRALAPDAEVVLIKAMSVEGRIKGKDVAHAIRFPLRYPHLKIRVMNVSLSTGDPDLQAEVESAVEEVVAAGITVFAAAGNMPGRAPKAPASSPHAITVGGLDDKGEREGEADASLWPSSYGTIKEGLDKPDLVAPAIWVPAPMIPGTLVAREANALFQLLSVLEELSVEQGFSEQKQRATRDEVSSVNGLIQAVYGRINRQKYISVDYQHVDGTSFAAPIAASVAAQMLEANPSLTPAQIREGLLATAAPMPQYPKIQQGAGLLRPRQAVMWAQQKKDDKNVAVVDEGALE